MSNFILVYAFIGFIIMLLSLALGLQKRNKREQKELDDLQHKIEDRKKQLSNMQYDTTQQLTKIEVEVLEQYDSTNIRIPIEIIEDLHHMRLTSEKDIVNFIETQRKYWKLENSKPMFRREVK